MGSAGAGTCNFWSAPFFSSMSPCTRIPEHLMQVPDLIDFALPVLFGGRWHILHMSMRVSIQENSFHCPLQSKFETRYEAMSLARILSSGLRCKIFIFRATFRHSNRAPRKRFFGPPILHIFALSAVSEEFGHIFRAPENIFRAGIRAPEKGWRRQIWASQDRK